MPDSARRQLRLRPAAVAFALGETIQLQHDAHVVGQHSDLDAAAQTAQAQCDLRCLQPWRAGDVAALRVERSRSPPIAPHALGIVAHRA
jgi:hypothetical protein